MDEHFPLLSHAGEGKRINLSMSDYCLDFVL